MWRALQNWRRRRTASRQRAIFRYWDGSRELAIDPMLAYRTLACHPTFIWREHPGQVDTDHEALAVTLCAIRDAFGVTEFSAERGTGLSQGETLELLVQFMDYLDAVKKNGNRFLILPPPTERKSSTTTREPTTKQESDSGSTSVEQKPEKLEESSAESSPPSENLP